MSWEGAEIRTDRDGRRILSVNAGGGITWLDTLLATGAADGEVVCVLNAGYGEPEWFRREHGEWVPHEPTKRQRQEAIPSVRDRSLGRRRQRARDAQHRGIR